MYVTDDGLVFLVVFFKEFWSMDVLDWFPCISKKKLVL